MNIQLPDPFPLSPPFKKTQGAKASRGSSKTKTLVTEEARSGSVLSKLIPSVCLNRLNTGDRPASFCPFSPVEHSGYAAM